MKIIYDPCVLLHNKENYGEGSYRLHGIEEVGVKVEGLPDPTDAILRIHSKVHLRKFKGACKSKVTLAEIKVSPASYNAALASVALSIHAAHTGDFAVTRPPGHHARKEIANGFCFLNNLAIAAQTLVDGGKRVFVIDIDGHYGDGTERLFYRTDRVFYSSIHQENSFPFKGGTARERGAGAGRGYTLNIPLRRGAGDQELLSSLEQIATEVDEFTPDVIAVSAGFDGYHKDQLLGLQYSLDGFSSAASFIRSLAVPTFAVLEGGYHHDVVDCIKTFVEGYNGQ